MTRDPFKRKMLLGLLMVPALSACYSERPVTPPAEPDWSYHDGDPSESNDADWLASFPEHDPANPYRPAVLSVETRFSS